jgi:hypothetical protein
MASFLKNLGAIERRIRRAFLSDPGRLWSTRELAEWGHPRRPIDARQLWQLVCRPATAVAERVGRRNRGKGGGSGKGQWLWRAKPGIEDMGR